MTSLQPQPMLRPHLIAIGLADPAIRALCRKGEWTAIRPGAYIISAELAMLGPKARHRLMIEAYRPILDSGTVLSHASAAIIHGLPVYRMDLTVQVTRNRNRSGRRNPHLHVHVSPLDVSEVVQLQGFTVTSLARTVLDVACTPLLGTGVAAADAALNGGLVRASDLVEGLAGLGQPRGISFARRTVAFADGRSESVGESLSRIAMSQSGLPVPALQVEVPWPDGHGHDRCDFEVTEYSTVGELDGLAKYGRWPKPGETPGQVVVREKIREDRIRDTGRQVVRWTWAELFRFKVVEQRWLRASERDKRVRGRP